MRYIVFNWDFAAMLIALKDVIKLYEKILQEININYTSVVIYVALDPDSVCTLKILTMLLKSENIQYKVYPVSTYTELENKIEETKVFDRIRLFFFINCGGRIDLTEKWFATLERITVFLFDANKPIHHKNIESEYIHLINDDQSQFQNCPTSEELNQYEELEEYDLGEDNIMQNDDALSDEDSPKRRSTFVYAEKIKKHRMILRSKIDNYYGREFYSLPSSYLSYVMVRDLNKANNEYLWLAIVGMTSMFIEQKISKEMFDSLSKKYRIDLSKFNLSTASRKEKGQIFQKLGYQFTLLDNWSLYEAMRNSTYLMIKLKLWEDKGLSKLNELLTTIGISLEEAKQLYCFMSKESRKKLEEGIFSNAQKFNIHDVAFLSFMRQDDYSSAYMASDYHYVLVSILEKPQEKKVDYQELVSHRVQNFWKAYDAFGASRDYFQDRIEEYKSSIKVIMAEVRGLIERDQIIALKTVNFANIKSDSQQRKIFEHPCTLIRLSYLLMGIQKQRDSRRSRQYKPFIGSYQDTEKGMCTMVGVMVDSKNFLGNKFNTIAGQLNIQMTQDSFKANILILPKDNLLQFIREVGGKN